MILHIRYILYTSGYILYIFCPSVERKSCHAGSPSLARLTWCILVHLYLILNSHLSHSCSFTPGPHAYLHFSITAVFDLRSLLPPLLPSLPPSPVDFLHPQVMWMGCLLRRTPLSALHPIQSSLPLEVLALGMAGSLAALCTRVYMSGRKGPKVCLVTIAT